MASFNKFNSFVADVSNKVHNLGSDALKIYLTNTAPSSANTVYNTPADLSTANGYTAGGAACTATTSAQTSGTYKLVVPVVSWTASGGSIGPFQYAVLYNNTAVSKQLIGWWDYGTGLTLTTGNTFTVSTDQTNGVLQIV